MGSISLSLIVTGTLMALVQFLAALPWLYALDPAGFKDNARKPAGLGYAALGVLGVGVLFGLVMGFFSVPANLEIFGRAYAALLHLQLVIDFFVIVPRLLLWVWPKGGAVAMAAFREGVRQPMFWLLTVVASVLITVSMVVPYFTFGDDFKMMKQIGFDAVMLTAALFGVLAAAISINEEIEGRTAVTLMSKPVTRRQFLLGKYIGIILAAWLMTLLIGWVLNWALYIKPYFDRLDDVLDPMPLQVHSILTGSWEHPRLMLLFGNPHPSDIRATVPNGIAAWFADAIANLLGLLLGFGQIMVLVAVAATLATRLPFVVNVVLCLMVFFLGHLAPVLVQVSNKLSASGETGLGLVSFIAKLVDTVMPALDYFNMGRAIIRDSPLDVVPFAIYVGTVFAYAVMYTAIALLLGLILFEDRDLA
jgi:ABC-type transport system involved in multi-copper enzyme maturation permease subunit